MAPPRGRPRGYRTVTEDMSDEALASVVVSRSRLLATEAWAILMARDLSAVVLGFLATNCPGSKYRNAAVQRLALIPGVPRDILRTAIKCAGPDVRRLLLPAVLD